MLTLSPLDLDLRVAAHQEQLLREAETGRLVRRLTHRQQVNVHVHVRQRLASMLHALACRLEPVCTPHEAISSLS